MKISFIAGLEEGFTCIKLVHKAGWDIDTIFTLSDKHLNRSAYQSFSDIEDLSSNFYYVDSVSEIREMLINDRSPPDLIILVGWSFIIPEEVIKIPKLGIIGTHPTLLPKGRGAAPIPWSIILGVEHSGISWFYLNDKIDSGEVLIQKEFTIEFEDSAREVYDKAVTATSEGLLEILPKIKDNTIQSFKTDMSHGYYLPRRKPEDGYIDWNKMTVFIFKWIKGLSEPYPGAFTFCNNIKYSIWDCKILDNKKAINNSPGRIEKIDKNGVEVLTSDGSLLITDMQLSGMSESIAFNEMDFTVGDYFN